MVEVKAFQIGNRVKIPDNRESRITDFIVDEDEQGPYVKYRVKNDVENWYGNFWGTEIEHT